MKLIVAILWMVVFCLIASTAIGPWAFIVVPAIIVLCAVERLRRVGAAERRWVAALQAQQEAWDHLQGCLGEQRAAAETLRQYSMDRLIPQLPDTTEYTVDAKPQVN